MSDSELTPRPGNIQASIEPLVIQVTHHLSDKNKSPSNDDTSPKDVILIGASRLSDGYFSAKTIEVENVQDSTSSASPVIEISQTSISPILRLESQSPKAPQEPFQPYSTITPISTPSKLATLRSNNSSGDVTLPTPPDSDSKVKPSSSLRFSVGGVDEESDSSCIEVSSSLLSQLGLEAPLIAASADSKVQAANPVDKVNWRDRERNPIPKNSSFKANLIVVPPPDTKPSSIPPNPLHNPNNTTNVYINGLRPFYPQAELIKLASIFGKVLSARVFHRFNHTARNGDTVWDQQGSTYAFVLYSTLEDAERCIRSLLRYSDLHPSFARTQRLPGSRGGLIAESLETEALLRSGVRTSKYFKPAATGASLLAESTEILIQGLPSNTTREVVESLLLPHVAQDIRLLPLGTDHSSESRLVAYVRLPSKRAVDETVDKFHNKHITGWIDRDTTVKLHVVITNPVEANSTDPSQVPQTIPNLQPDPRNVSHATSQGFRRVAARMPSSPRSHAAWDRPSPGPLNTSFANQTNLPATSSMAHNNLNFAQPPMSLGVGPRPFSMPTTFMGRNLYPVSPLDRSRPSLTATGALLPPISGYYPQQSVYSGFTGYSPNPFGGYSGVSNVMAPTPSVASSSWNIRDQEAGGLRYRSGAGGQSGQGGSDGSARPGMPISNLEGYLQYDTNAVNRLMAVIGYGGGPSIASSEDPHGQTAAPPLTPGVDENGYATQNQYQPQPFGTANTQAPPLLPAPNVARTNAKFYQVHPTSGPKPSRNLKPSTVPHNHAQTHLQVGANAIPVTIANPPSNQSALASGASRSKATHGRWKGKGKAI